MKTTRTGLHFFGTSIFGSHSVLFRLAANTLLVRTGSATSRCSKGHPNLVANVIHVISQTWSETFWFSNRPKCWRLSLVGWRPSLVGFLLLLSFLLCFLRKRKWRHCTLLQEIRLMPEAEQLRFLAALQKLMENKARSRSQPAENIHQRKELSKRHKNKGSKEGKKE